MKKTLLQQKESDKTQKSIQNVLSLEEMITIRGGGKVVDPGGDIY
jgi:hypothetical protein